MKLWRIIYTDYRKCSGPSNMRASKILYLCITWNCPILHTEKASPASYIVGFFFSCQELLNVFKGTLVSRGKYQECRVHICKSNLQTDMTIIGTVCTLKKNNNSGHLNESGTSAQGDNYICLTTVSARPWDANAASLWKTAWKCIFVKCGAAHRTIYTLLSRCYCTQQFMTYSV